MSGSCWDNGVVHCHWSAPSTHSSTRRPKLLSWLGSRLKSKKVTTFSIWQIFSAIYYCHMLAEMHWRSSHANLRSSTLILLCLSIVSIWKFVDFRWIWVLNWHCQLFNHLISLISHDLGSGLVANIRSALTLMVDSLRSGCRGVEWPLWFFPVTICVINQQSWHCFYRHQINFFGLTCRFKTLFIGNDLGLISDLHRITHIAPSIKSIILTIDCFPIM